VLVGHDWGAPIVFDYARLSPGRVRGIAFLEGVLPPMFPQASFEGMGATIGGMFRTFKDPVKGRELVVGQNFFIEQLLPQFVNRPMTDAELESYRRPFLDVADREALLTWPREVPIGGEPADVAARMESIGAFMRDIEMPLLLLYGDPGVVLPVDLVDWYVENLKDVETVYLGRGLHFLQEDHPDAIGRAVNDWLRRIRGPRTAAMVGARR
jgi:haloalkane dehalogenase